MKKIYITLTLLLSFLTAAAQNFAGEVELIRQVLEEKGDSLHVELDIMVRGEAMNTCEDWTIVPCMYVDNKVEIDLPSILVNGKNKKQMMDRRSKFTKTDIAGGHYVVVNAHKKMPAGVIKYVYDIPYEGWMDEATLAVKQIKTSCASKQQMYFVATGGNVKLQPRVPYEVKPLVTFVVPEKEVKQRNMQGQAFIDFQVNRSVIIPTYRRNPEELAKIRNVINTVMKDRDVEIKGLFIEGYASPEGSYANNDRLSRERARALKNYLLGSFALPEAMFKVSSVAEDWEGLRVAVEQSSIAEKEQILRIIDNDESADRKKVRLKSLAGGRPYATMLKELYPPLRRVEYRIDFTVKDYTVEETRVLATKNPAYLSLYELYILSQQYPADSEERVKLFELMQRQNIDNPIANINGAAIMLQRGDYKAAKHMLDRAKDDARAVNNLGVYYLCVGELDKAKECFNRAMVMGINEANHNLKEVEIKRADNVKMERYRARQK